MSVQSARHSAAKAASSYAFLLVVTAVVLAPFVVMAVTALTPERLVLSGGASLTDLTLENFRVSIAETQWGLYFRNSFIVIVTTLLGATLLSLPAAYDLARHERGHRAMGFVIAALVIPPQVTALPVFLFFSRLGLADTLAALVLPFLGSAFAIFLFRQFIARLPGALFDAARMDGLSEFGIVFRIVLPAMWPAIIAYGVFATAFLWNDLFWPSVMLRTLDAATVPYAFGRFASPDAGIHYGATMASAVIAVLPVVAAFLLVQHKLSDGLSMRGVEH